MLALGDSNYTHYCKTGRTVDSTLEGYTFYQSAKNETLIKFVAALGAKRFVDKTEVDQEDWPVIEGWFSSVKASLPKLDLDTRADYIVSRRYNQRLSEL